MTDTMTVRVETRPRSFLDEQATHRTAEGVEPAGTESVIDDVTNVKQIFPENHFNEWSDTYWEYPMIQVTDADGDEHVVDHGSVDLSETDPGVEIFCIRNETDSYHFGAVTTFEAYGVQSEDFIDEFDRERTTHRFLIDKDDGQHTLYSPLQPRQFLVRYPNGDTRLVGDEHHSPDTQRKFGEDGPDQSPYSNETGTYSVVANGTLHENVVHAYRTEPGEYVLTLSDGSTVETDDISDASGPLYTVVAKHRGKFGHGTTVTSVKRALGVYVDETPNELYEDGKRPLVTINHPNTVEVYKTPTSKRIDFAENIESVLVKTPSGDIIRNLDDLPVLQERM